MIQSGTGEYGSFDLPGILSSMTKYTGLATTPKQAIQGLQHAIKHTMTGRKAPTSLVIYQPEVYEEYIEEQPPYIYDMEGYMVENHFAPSTEQLKRVSEMLIASKNPVIIAGNGVHMSKAHDEVRELAETIGAPVATTYKGKSTISEYHSLAVGMMGDYGQLSANQVIGQADIILVLGSKLGPSDTSQENLGLINPKKQKIIQVDIDPHRAAWVYPTEATLIGDLKLTIKQLLPLLKGIDKNKVASRMEELILIKGEIGYYENSKMYQDSSSVLPQRIIGILNEVLPEDSFLMMDAGSNRSWTAHLYKSKSAGSVLVPGGIAGMGSSVPFGVATKLVYPDRPVVCVIGDGGFAMTSNAISTAVQYNAPIIVIIMNDSRLGMPAARQGEDRIATDFIDTNFAMIAQGYGATGVRVDNSIDLENAVKQALIAGSTTVIDVLIDVDEKYTTIQPFPETMKKYKKNESNPYTENAFF